MGVGVSSRGGGYFKFPSKRHKQCFRIDPVVLSKEEVNEILGEDGQRPGTYLLYEDVEKERVCIAFRKMEGDIHHYSIVKLNDFFYCNDFPFPYLESIVLYHKKYKFDGTKLTHQAVLTPCIRSQRSKRISSYLKLDTARDGERDSHV